MILATDSYYFPTQDLRTGLSNASTMCFLWGTTCVYTYRK